MRGRARCPCGRCFHLPAKTIVTGLAFFDHLAGRSKPAGVCIDAKSDDGIALLVRGVEEMSSRIEPDETRQNAHFELDATRYGEHIFPPIARTHLCYRTIGGAGNLDLVELL